MPTCDRRGFIPAAIACYQAQIYPNKELIIADNGQDSIEDLVPAGATYRHVGQDKLTTGAMRNQACQLAKGPLICHFDDDDWSHPERMIDQFRMLQQMQCSLSGYNEMFFIDEKAKRAWLYRNPELYALGTSLMYSKAFWMGNKFPDVAVAEDTEFIMKAQWKRSMMTKAAGDRMVARIHSSNTCDKTRFIDLSPMWVNAPYAMVREMIYGSEEKQEMVHAQSSSSLSEHHESG